MKEILTAWQWDGPVSEPIPYGEGHINQTYAITVTSEQGAKRYILQKINTEMCIRDRISYQRTADGKHSLTVKATQMCIRDRYLPYRLQPV